ncbi:MAG TPA: hypothetical protein VIQ39_02580 [Methyloceanibacter sp.]
MSSILHAGLAGCAAVALTAMLTALVEAPAEGTGAFFAVSA